MNLEELARKLVEEVEGMDTAKNVEGVVEVFKGLILGVNGQWEQFLAKETNEVLMRDKIKCNKCNNKMVIERTRDHLVASSH